MPAENTAAPQKEDDASFYKDIQPTLDELERLRKKNSQSFIIRLVVGIFIGLPILYGAYLKLNAILPHTRHGLYFVAITTPACFFMVMLCWIFAPIYSYHGSYKKTVIPRLVSLLGLDHYEESGEIPMFEMRTTEILPPFNGYDCAEYFQGGHKGAKISFCKVNLRWVEKKSNNIVYTGIVFLIDIPKNKFTGHTVLVKSQGHLFSWLGKKFPAEFKTVHLEDPVFNKQYQVFSNDQVEARCILDPAMMERVEEISNMYFSKGVTISYDSGNRIFALIPFSGDFFKAPSIWCPATDVYTIARMKNEIKSMLSLIDLLDVYKPPAADSA